MDIKVKITEIFTPETITSKDGSKTWEKLEFWAEDDSNPMYPVEMPFELFGADKVALMNNFDVGDRVSVDFNIKSNKWEPAGKPSRLFIKFDVWRISPLQNATQAQPVSQSQAIVDEINGDGGDDLPF